jgi:hypothetical protein
MDRRGRKREGGPHLDLEPSEVVFATLEDLLHPLFIFLLQMLHEVLK